MIRQSGEPIPVMIVPLLTGADYLYRMAASIDYPVSRLLVIDNGMCVDGAKLRDATSGVVGGITVLPLPANLGVSGSWNLGIKATAHAPWWLIANFDVVWPEGSLRRFAESNADGILTLSGGSPPWCAFAVPDSVIARVGLFDEQIHPAYFEDDDYVARCRHFQIPIVYTDIPVKHDNSTTLAHGYDGANSFTFTENRRYVERKHSLEDYTDGGYSLLRRRRLSWD